MKSKKQLKNLAPSSLLLFSLLFLGLCCFSNCGRKRRYPFSFAEKTTPTSIASLDLPSIQNVCAKTTRLGNKVSWDYLPDNEKQSLIKKNAHFVGYNIYCLTKNGFMPKKSLNDIPVTKNYYLDSKKRSNAQLPCTSGVQTTQ